MTEEKTASTETPVTEPISKAPDAVETPVPDSKTEPAKDQKDDESVSEPANVEESEEKTSTTEEKPANGAVSNGHEEQKKPVTNGKTRSQNGKETASEPLEEEKVTKPSAPKKKRTERKPDSAPTTNDSFEVGTVVLAKVKGYPSWPGIVSLYIFSFFFFFLFIFLTLLRLFPNLLSPPKSLPPNPNLQITEGSHQPALLKSTPLFTLFDFL